MSAFIGRWRRSWESTFSDKLDPGCVALLGETTDDDELPYVVLFARALAYPERSRRRTRMVLDLAAAYRELFGVPMHGEHDEGTDPEEAEP